MVYPKMTNLIHTHSDTHSRPFKDVYHGKCVLVTGHTGFKGSWLCTWLLELGADVVGYSTNPPSVPLNFEILGLEKKLKHINGDIRDIKHLKRVFDEIEPDVVFHLAARAITHYSYDIPQETFYTNLGGTVNVLECIRQSKSVKAGIIITSDKCYQNVEWIWGYRENDKLGGDDPYSASKACAEIASRSYIKSFFSGEGLPKVSTARAGNVIAGGDWAGGRIIPDCMRAFSKDECIEIRCPEATRPWQYVLEPLSGYLWLGTNLLNNNREVAGGAFNFGPQSQSISTVGGLVKDFAKMWGEGKWRIAKTSNFDKKEPTLLKLNCDKALHYLNWFAALPYEKMVKMTVSWYKTYYGGDSDMYSFTTKQIMEYTDAAKKKGLEWAK